jgi:hypothetical protein
MLARFGNENLENIACSRIAGAHVLWRHGKASLESSNPSEMLHLQEAFNTDSPQRASLQATQHISLPTMQDVVREPSCSRSTFKGNTTLPTSRNWAWWNHHGSCCKA